MDIKQFSYNKNRDENISKSYFSLFDMKITDHILQDEDAVGWALQGTLVSDVYPDAVSKIKELYENGSDILYRNIICKRSIDGRYIADFSQKDAINELFDTTGIADFYIIDNKNNQFYLPKSIWFTQYTLNTELINNYNEAGLPNVQGTFVTIADTNINNTYGSFRKKAVLSGGNLGSGGAYKGDSVIFDASLSSLVYGKSTTVQPQSSLKLLYYKVGNTY